LPAWAFVVWVGGGVAHAHVDLDSPTPRPGTAQKDPPCGAVGGVRSSNVTVFRPGSQITVTWHETIDHTGHYRLAFDTNGDSHFRFPGVTAPAEQLVLQDNIAESPSQMYSKTVTLPNVECSNCTLQLIQVMATHAPPYTDPELYFRCADIVLSNTLPVGPMTAASSSSGSTSGAASPTSQGTAGTTTTPQSAPSNDTGGCLVGPRSAWRTDQGRGLWLLLVMGAALCLVRRSRSQRPRPRLAQSQGGGA
jgi:hypothetical protein